MSDAPKDAASILFPNDVPSGPAKAPEYFKVEQSQAAARLAGFGNLSKPADAARPDPQSAAMFPSEVKAAQVTAPAQGAKAVADHSAGPDAAQADTAAKLFKDDAAVAADKAFDGAREFFSGFQSSAAADGDNDRAGDLEAAGAALIENAKATGMPANELSAALDVVKERQGDTIAEISDEKLAEEYASSMATLQSELGPNAAADIALAQALIRDVERIAPGTMDSLVATGAGNDIRLLRSVIREAKRRGYR